MPRILHLCHEVNLIIIEEPDGFSPNEARDWTSFWTTFLRKVSNASEGLNIEM
jgi:hypothetical protein